MTESRPRAVIAGAGLAGLALAHGLSSAGFAVSVFEVDPGPDVRRQGYRITVDHVGIAALRECLPPALFDLVMETGGAPGGYFRFTNSQLREAFKLTFDGKAEGSRQLDRQVLRAALLSGLGDSVEFGARAIAVAPDGDRAALTLEDGRTVSADVVIGADGIGSALRAQMTSGAEPVDSGAVGIYGSTLLNRQGRTVVPDALGKSGVLALGEQAGRAFFFTAMRFLEPPAVVFARLPGAPQLADRPDYVMWGVVLRADELPQPAAALQSAELLAFARRSVADFHPVIREIVDQGDSDATLLSRFANASRPTAWTIPSATLMGDAIHPMPPVGADGGNTALRDAAELGRRLTQAHSSGSALTAAIADYQHAMTDYGFTAADAAARSLRRLSGRGGIQKWMMVRLLPALHRPLPQPPGTAS